MSVGLILAQALTGLASAATLFLVSVGLSLVFGITRVVNFAHGAFFMIGAYVAYTLVDRLGDGTAPIYWLCVATAALIVGGIGALVEIVLMRRMYKAPELFQLLATFAVSLIIDDVLPMIFGTEDLLAPRVRSLRGGIDVLGARVPIYDLYLVGVAVIVVVALYLALTRTRWGILIRAATQDRDMVGALGVNQAWLFTSVFTLGVCLAGLAGAMQLGRTSANLGMGSSIITEAFVVVVIGGMGSITGALVAAILIGELTSFGIAYFPQLNLVLMFLVMAAVLAVRPSGLFGKPESLTRQHEFANEPPLRATSRPIMLLGLAVVALLAAAPALLGAYGLSVIVDVMIAAVFAGSLYLILGPGGLVTFGHACYFGIGAYAVALSVRYGGFSFAAALALAPVAAACFALLFGWLSVRVSGVYFAMLTFALAQIVWSIVFQWYKVTGGDNGLIGLAPAGLSPPLFYVVTLALSAVSIAILGWIPHSALGYALRVTRDSPARAAAIGINVRATRLVAFVITGMFAGLAGGLFTFAKGSVFPTAISIGRSIDGLVMVLLGGVQTIVGPVVGAAIFFLMQSEILRYTDKWRLILGVLIILIVLVFPKGIIGSLAEWRSGEQRR
ncbi:branched-chain amino acid transport system permease protein [Nitrobacteraceae bacterium AZCC 2161]